MATLNLNADVMTRIGSFMSPSEAVTLTHVNKEIRENSNQLLKNQYRKTFGEMSQTQQPDKKIIARLLCCAEKQPDAAVDHNIYKAPGSRLERWKWIVGVENSLDREVQENYNRNISLLENTQATSFIQLKNQMKGFWHTDRQIKDYAQFKSDEIKSDEKARETSGLISKVFFACLGFLLKLYFNPSVLNIGKKLETRSRETFAKIGGFNLNDKDYDVVAFHILADEKSEDQYKIYHIYHDDTHLKFRSSCHGKTWVGIFERQQPHSFESLGHNGPNQNFQVLLGREEANDRFRLIYGEPFISDEHYCDHGQNAVLNSRRHLKFFHKVYSGRTKDPKGSDRQLDQKLTQILVEMTMQNKDIISLRIDQWDLLVLTAGGFKSDAAKRIMKIIDNFRSEEGNKLFPPYMDSGGTSIKFNTKDVTEKNVHYSRGAPESWSDIIQREPILKPDAGILPEYWARKPNVVEG